MAAGTAPLPLNDRRARRKAETRSRLLSAARALFIERGYHTTRPQDIARTADVATGSFYSHFADKREVYLAFVTQASNEVLARMAAEPQGDSFHDRLAGSLHALLAYVDENPGVMSAAFSDPAMIDSARSSKSGMHGQIAEVLAEGLRTGMREGRLRDGFDPHLIAHAIVGLVHQALVYGGQHKMNRDLLVEQITQFCDFALVSPVQPNQEDSA